MVEMIQCNKYNSYHLGGTEPSASPTERHTCHTTDAFSQLITSQTRYIIQRRRRKQRKKHAINR